MDKQIIQSYGRKRARGLSVTQKTNLIDLYKVYGIELPLGKVSPKQLFSGKFNDVVLEIGFGRGEHLINCAKAEPNTGFIGCEPFENGVASTLKGISDNNLDNILIYKGDARVLLNEFEENAIKRTYVLFPDPWTKKRHYKRRLLSVEFILELKKKSTQCGDLIIATDCRDYMDNVLENLKAVSGILYCNDTEKLTNKPSGFVETRYEQKALSKGKKCYYLKINFQ